MLLSKKNTSNSPSSANPIAAKPTSMNASDLAFLESASENVTILAEVSPSNATAKQQKEPKPVDSSEQMKSFCKVKDHGKHEIIFACYECRDTFCSHCIESHISHTVIFFKDSYMVANYDYVTQMHSQSYSQQQNKKMHEEIEAKDEAVQAKDPVLSLTSFQTQKALTITSKE